MSWWLAIPAVLTAVDSISQAGSASSQNEDQASWNRYNADMQYATTMNNIAAQTALASVNAQNVMMIGAMQKDVYEATAGLNRDTIAATTRYNTELMQEELSLMWKGVGLDISLLEDQRAVERGAIVGQQAASGTVIGQDSAAEVIIDQKTQEAKDAFVIRHNADIQAARINNAIAQSEWKGEAEMRKVMWEGEVGGYSSMFSAGIESSSIMQQAAISAEAGGISAGYQLDAGLAGADLSYNTNEQQISNNLHNGLFSSASQGVGAYYQSLMI